MKKVVKYFVYFLSLIFLIGPLIGCGLFDRYHKNEQGYYEEHYSCCGPVALEKALNLFFARPHDGVIICFKKPFDRKELSQLIQKNGIPYKEALALFNKEALCITWPSEIKGTLKEYNVSVVELKSLDELDAEKDVAIVLVYTDLYDFHWLCFPFHKNIKNWHGEDTKIDKIYLLKLK